jgi:hypothetical protein
MDGEIKPLLRLLKAYVQEGAAPKVTLESGVDWSGMIQISRRHGVLPFVVLVLEKTGLIETLAPEIQLEISAYVDQARYENRIKQMEFRKIAALFSEANIPLIPLKGMALTHTIYREAPVRRMGDIDLQIPEQDAARARALLLKRGFSETELMNRWQTEIATRTDGLAGKATYSRDGLVLDLQWKPVFRIGGSLIPWNAKEAWENAAPAPFMGPNVRMHVPLDQARYLLLQAAGDLETQYLFLMQLLDLALVMNRYGLASNTILGADLAKTSPPMARKAMESLLRFVDECLISGENGRELSGEVHALSEYLLAQTFDLSRRFSGRLFLSRQDISLWSKGLFLAGYFFPSEGALRPYRERGWLGILSGYGAHWHRLAVKGARLLTQFLGCFFTCLPFFA